jgi:hypothetical protein
MPGGFYEFGPLRLDPAERLLLRDERLALTPKATASLPCLDTTVSFTLPF